LRKEEISRNAYQILSLLGIGTIFGTLWTYTIRKLKEQKAASDALKLGVQALLRARMISEFNKWSERGYAPIWARQNFENMWEQYEALGSNGVMGDIHNKFLALPTDDGN